LAREFTILSTGRNYWPQNVILLISCVNGFAILVSMAWIPLCSLCVL
jgi:hypothetical protein